MQLAYKYVAATLMALFLNQHAERLGITADEVTELQPGHVSVGEAGVSKVGDGDLMLTEHYSVGYATNSYVISYRWLHSRRKAPYASNHADLEDELLGGLSITKLEKDGKTSYGIPLLEQREPSRSLMERASRMPYVITNKAAIYKLATNFLHTLDIDPVELERKAPLHLDENSMFHSERGLVPNPLVYIMWGKPELRDPGSNGVAMKFSAVTGELLELNAGVFVCKDAPRIKNLSELLLIPDESFLKYTDAERSNLVARFASENFRYLTKTNGF